MVNDKDIIEYVLSKNGLSINQKITMFESGQKNRVYDVGSEFIIKIEGDGPKNQNCLKGQKQISEKLISIGAKVPRIIEEDVYQGKRFLLMGKVKGKILTRLWLKMGKEQRQDAMRQIAEQIKLFHTLRFESFALKTYKGREFQTFKQTIEEAVDFSLINRSALTIEQREILEYLEDFFVNKIHILEKKEQAVFVHNDIHFENIFFSSDKLVGIIDFDRWSKAPLDYELHKTIDFFHTPFRYVEKPLEPKYKEAMVAEIKWLKKYYPELFQSKDLLDRIRLYYIETAIWLINLYQNGNWGDSAMVELSEKFKDFYKGDWLNKALG